MAEYGIRATQLSGPSMAGTGFIRQPVADESKVDLLKNVLGQAGEAYQGYQLASLEKEQEAVIDEYISSKQNPAIIAETEDDIGALDAAAEGLWNRVASQPDYQPDVTDFSGVERTLNEKLAKLKAAKDQGVMSPDEFANRILATTREAVARNPGLYQELKQHSARVLELSGITDIIRSDLEQAKSAEKQKKDMQDYYLQLGKQHNVSVPYGPTGEINWNRFVEQIQYIQNQELQVNVAKNVGSLDDEQRKAQGKMFMDTNGVSLMNGSLSNSLNTAITLMNEGSDPQGALTQLRLMLNQERQNYTSQFSPISNEPAVKAAFEYYDKQAQLIEDLVSKAVTKEDAVRASNNALKLLQNKEYTDVSKFVNREALSAITSLFSTAGAARIIDQNPQAMGDVMRTLGNVFSGAANGLGTNYSATIGPNNAVSMGVKHLAENAVKDPTVLPVLERTLSTIAQDIRNPSKFPEQADKFRFYEKLVKDLGSAEVKAGLSKIGAEGYRNSAELIDDYMTMTTPAMNTSIKKWENQGVSVQLDVLPDGRMLFKTNNQVATRDLNSRYTSRINDSLAAMANLMGIDTKSVAVEHFYPNYLPNWLGDPDLKETKITNPSELEAARTSGKITPQEYEAIKQQGFGTRFKSQSEMKNDRKLQQLEDRIITLSGAEQMNAVEEHRKYLLDTYGVSY